MDGDRRRELLARYRVTGSKHFQLSHHDPADRPDWAPDHEGSKELLAEGVERLAELQGLLYANGTRALLACFQALDAGGKDGTIRHVMSGVNPQGVSVASFKQPGPAELGHDFLWRIHQAVPARGRIGIFNRSHYEEVLVARVHPDVLEKQNLPGAPGGDGDGAKFWHRRMKDIRHFESYLGRQGVTVLKFFLNISRDEQKQRFLSRLEEPDKNWKFSASDLAERQHWDAYQDAYADAVAHTATKEAPWYVVPGDRKWFARLVVVEAMIAALEDMALETPEPVLDRKALAKARKSLEAEAG